MINFTAIFIVVVAVGLAAIVVLDLISELLSGRGHAESFPCKVTLRVDLPNVPGQHLCSADEVIIDTWDYDVKMATPPVYTCIKCGESVRDFKPSRPWECLSLVEVIE